VIGARCRSPSRSPARDEVVAQCEIMSRSTPRTGIDAFATALEATLARQTDVRAVEQGRTPAALFDRLETQRDRALNRGEIGRYLVTFADNHDPLWQLGAGSRTAHPMTGSLASSATSLCALGMPCIYYGTEQGFSGSGGDNQMREAMFE
jgi:hypothetical protein